MDYKSKDVQTLFSVSAETVRKWSEEFSEYLSPLATPGHGRHRIFSSDDLHVFALIAELKNKGMTYADIGGALANGQRGEIPEGSPERGLTLRSALELDYAQRQILALSTERDELQSEVQSLREENIRLKTQLESSDKQSEEMGGLRQQIADLNRQIGRLEGKLESIDASD